MTFDPVQLGQALGAIAVTAATAFGVIRHGLTRWSKQQAEERRKNTAEDKRALRSAIRGELRMAMSNELKNALAEQLKAFTARLERVEHVVERMLAGRTARPAGPTKRRARKRG